MSGPFSHSGPPPPPPPPYHGHYGHGHPPPPPPPHHHHFHPHYSHPGTPPSPFRHSHGQLCSCGQQHGPAPWGGGGHGGRHGHHSHGVQSQQQPRQPGRSFREEFYDDGTMRIHRIWIERSIETASASHGADDLSHPAKVAHELAMHIIQNAALDPGSTSVLDVGVDTHDFHSSRILQSRVGSITGLAFDPRVTSAYNAHASADGLAKERMFAIHVHAMNDLSQLHGMNFDIVLCAQPIEQRPDIVTRIPSLVQLLKPGGRLFLASLDLSLRAVQRGEASDAAAYRNERIEEICAELGLSECQTSRVDTYGYLPSEPGVLYVIETSKGGLPPPPNTSTSAVTISRTQ